MATRSFTFKQSTSASVGSFLQQNPNLLPDDDSMLRGDGFVATPDVIATDNTINVEVAADSYSSALITWNLGIGLSTTPGPTPTATRFLCVYSPEGYPQTVAAGSLVFSSQATSGTFNHTDLLPGKWAYYSFFVLYESSAYRSWYELVGSIEELIPVDHQSTEDLWRRIPRHYRLQDQEMAEDPLDQNSYGPLHKVLDIFGWDIDRVRTLVDYQMTAKDPNVAEVEALDALAYETGLPINSNDLGPARLRNLINNARINNSTKGTLSGVEQTLGAVAGSAVEITPTRPQLLTANQVNFSSIVTNAAPTGNQWSYSTAASVSCAASAGGLAVTRTGGTGYVYTVVSTAVPISQASRYRSYYDVLNSNGASVTGAYLSTTFTGASSWTVDGTSGFVSEGPDTWVRQTSGSTPWYQAPQDHGIVGNGTFTSGTAYLHIVVVLGPGPSGLLIRNPLVTSLNMYPYSIDVYSERVNLLKDPKFANPINTSASVSATNYWNTRSTGGSVSVTKSSGVLTSSVTGLDVQEIKNLGSGGSALNARSGSTSGIDENDPVFLAHDGTNYLYLPGVSGNISSTPTTAALDITGDVEIVCRVALADLTSIGTIISKGTGYLVYFDPAGTRLVGYANSTFYNSTAVPYAAGQPFWFKFTRVAATGAANFYFAADQASEPTSWTSSGSATSGAGNLSTNSDNLSIGANTISGSFKSQIVYRAIVRNGIGGTPVFDADFTTGITDGAQTSLSISGTAAEITNAQVLTNAGSGGPLLNAQVGSAVTTTTNDPDILPHTGENYLYLPGVANNAVTFPDSNDLDVDSFEIIARVALDDWGNATVNQSVVSKYTNTTLGGISQRSYMLRINNRYLLLDYIRSAANTTVLQANTQPGFLDSTTLPNGSYGWIRVTRDSATGTVQFFKAADTGSPTTLPSSWTQATTSGTQTAGALYVTNSTTNIGAFGETGVGYPLAGKVSRVIIRNAASGGTAVLDTNMATDLTSGSQTSLVEDSANAATGTILRSSSGRKTTVVVRPTILFGTDDFLALDDNDLIDLNASDSATVMVSARVWGTPVASTRFFHKGGSLSARWGLSIPGTGALNRVQGFISDGVGPTVLTESETFSSGALFTGAATFDRSSQTITAHLNGVAGTPSTSIAGLNASSTALGRIGSNELTGYIDMEFFGAAIWKRVLSAAELQTVSDHYAGNVTAVSLALLSEAAVWIDPARSKKAASISRSTSGRKSVAVVRPTMLFGSNDYLEVADNDLLDFGAGDSFTVVSATRIWNTMGAGVNIVNKRSGVDLVGWVQRLGGGVFTPQTVVDDGADLVVTQGGNITAGALVVITGVIDRAAVTGTTYRDTTAGIAQSISTIGSIANSYQLRIGGTPDGSTYADMEFFGAAVFRRALTQAEIALVTTHWQTGPTTASRALLSEAVLWLDPANSVFMSFYLNDNVDSRLKPVRTGVEYSFSVVDSGSTIQEVRLVSRSFGTISTATTPYREESSLDGTRRYYALFRAYDDPWLPLNIADCYVEIIAWLSPDQTANFTRPLLEPLLRGGEYFDGDSINGGWLKGEDFNGTADYRWGGGTPNQAFSYYATDYVRMRQTIVKMIPYVVPTTETGISIDNGTLRFNRIFGHTGTDMP